MRRLFSYLLILFAGGFLSYGGFLYFERINPARLSFNEYPSSRAKTHSSDIPVNLQSKNVHINVSLYPATVTGSDWPTTTRGALFLTGTPPGEIGNSIIYAHNFTSLFGNLIFIKPGDKVTITYKNAPGKTFIIAYTAVVSPQDVSILRQSQDTRITLFTCTGFLDSKRFVAVGVLE